MIRPLTSWLLVTIALIVAAPMAVQLAGVQLPATSPGASGSGSAGTLLAWALLSNGLIAAVLLNLGARSTRRGAALGVGLFAIAFGLGHFAGLIEAWFFGVLTGELTARLAVMGAITSLVGCVGAVWLTKRDRAAMTLGNASPWRLSPARLVAVAALYVVIYFAAGVLVFPFIRDFYTAAGLPHRGLIAAVQFFARGPLFAVLLSWLVCSTSGTRAERALRAAVTLSLVGGIAPLLLPNPFMPDAVRWAHSVEVGVSHVIFGALAGWLLAPQTRAGVASTGRDDVSREVSGHASA
jgi:hypothetical protein